MTEIDRDSIKKMADSLTTFSRVRSLSKMTKDQLANMPKEVVIASAPQEIPPVWEELSKHIQGDVDILKYQYCSDHYSISSEECVNIDVNGGPLARKICCCYCKVRGVNLAANNETNISSTPQKTTLTHCCNPQ